MNPIYLLDDSATGNATDANMRGLQELTRAALAPPKPQPKFNPPAPQPQPAPRTTQASPQSRVFTSRPTLRQLMSEYNRFSSRLSPIMAADNGAPPTARDFSFDRIDLIRVASIPGKVLRPVR